MNIDRSVENYGKGMAKCLADRILVSYDVAVILRRPLV